MNPEAATTYLGWATMACTGGFALVRWRTKEKRDEAKEAAKERDAEEKRARQAADTGHVTMQSINDAIAKERDRAEEKLARQTAAHKQEITDLRDQWERDAAEMRRGLDQEASELKRRYDEAMATMSTRLAECQHQLTECQATVSRLYEELLEMQRMLPPGVVPPSRKPPAR